MQRFNAEAEIVQDKLTGLVWFKDAALSEFPLTWEESLDFVAGLNSRRMAGYADWRLPNRRELFSLVSHSTINPALPAGHPFENVFNGYYWTATTEQPELSIRQLADKTGASQRPSKNFAVDGPWRAA